MKSQLFLEFLPFAKIRRSPILICQLSRSARNDRIQTKLSPPQMSEFDTSPRFGLNSQVPSVLGWSWVDIGVGSRFRNVLSVDLSLSLSLSLSLFLSLSVLPRWVYLLHAIWGCVASDGAPRTVRQLCNCTSLTSSSPQSYPLDRLSLSELFLALQPKLDMNSGKVESQTERGKHIGLPWLYNSECI